MVGWVANKILLDSRDILVNNARGAFLFRKGAEADEWNCGSKSHSNGGLI